MSRKSVQKAKQSRRSFTEEFKREAVAMLLDSTSKVESIHILHDRDECHSENRHGSRR